MTPIRIRQLHAYIGLFVAPSVLFFAFTGALQLFNLHESHDDYRPYAVIEKLSRVHKDQVFALNDQQPAPVPGPEDHPAAPAANGAEDEDKVSTVILKSFFLLVSLCLILSSSFGLWMGLTQTRRKGIAWVLLAAGTLIPLGLLLF
jgi:hypothetical protein